MVIRLICLMSCLIGGRSWSGGKGSVGEGDKEKEGESGK